MLNLLDLEVELKAKKDSGAWGSKKIEDGPSSGAWGGAVMADSFSGWGSTNSQKDVEPSGSGSFGRKEILQCGVNFKNVHNDRRVVLYLNDCDCGDKHCTERAAFKVKYLFLLRKVSIKDVAVEFLSEHERQQETTDDAGLVGHVHLDKELLEKSYISMEKVLSMVTKGMLTEHLHALASNMTCAGFLIGFNLGGIEALNKTLKFQVPFSEATLYTPKRCFEKAAEKCHSDSLSSIVGACSWGKSVSVGTGSRFNIQL